MSKANAILICRVHILPLRVTISLDTLLKEIPNSDWGGRFCPFLSFVMTGKHDTTRAGNFLFPF